MAQVDTLAGRGKAPAARGGGSMSALSKGFGKLAQWTARHAGRPATFALALAIIVVWAVSGPIFGWSDTWQLIINTGTTIVTFLMVFLIQNTQNRDTEALNGDRTKTSRTIPTVSLDSAWVFERRTTFLGRAAIIPDATWNALLRKPVLQGDGGKHGT